MKKPSNRRELEEMIRRFYQVDRLLPPVLPAPIRSELARYIIIPDDERSPEDVLADIDRRTTSEDFEVWDNVGRWLCEVPWCLDKQIVCLRCQGRGWKKIAYVLQEKKYTDRFLHRASLWRHFNSGLDEMLKVIGSYVHI